VTRIRRAVACGSIASDCWIFGDSQKSVVSRKSSLGSAIIQVPSKLGFGVGTPIQINVKIGINWRPDWKSGRVVAKY
jgi:hypothetical protein